MRIHADGYIDLRRSSKIRTPGPVVDVEPSPEDQAVEFLLSHAFPGHRKVTRPLTEGHRRRIRLARCERTLRSDPPLRHSCHALCPPRQRSPPGDPRQVDRKHPERGTADAEGRGDPSVRLTDRGRDGVQPLLELLESPR